MSRTTKAWHTRVTPDEKLVLLCIAHHVDEYGDGIGDERAISARTGLPRVEAREHVRRLLAAGILTRAKRWHGDDAWSWSYDIGGPP